MMPGEDEREVITDGDGNVIREEGGIHRPEWIKIGPFNWVVLYDAGVIRSYEATDGNLRFGATDPLKLMLVVDPNRPEGGIRETLWHELTHALVWATGINLDTGQASVAQDEDLQETVVSQLATAQLAMLRDNPDLVRYLACDDGQVVGE